NPKHRSRGPPMTNASDFPEGDAGRPGPGTLRDPEGHLDPRWLDHLRARLAAGEAAALVALVQPLHVSDTGDVLEALEPAERVRLVTLLGDDFDYSALTEVDDAIRSEILEALPNEQVARGVSALDSDDAVQI